MNRTDTAIKDEKRRQNELREMAKWEKELAKPQGRGYFYYLVFLICVVYIMDEVATQIGAQMQTVVAQALFAPVFGADMAVARMSAIGMIAFPVTFLFFLYKPLSDRYGRRIFLVLNTLGMGIGLLLISISTNIPVYIIGSVFVGFFVPHDVQVVYILETMPPKRRATGYSVIKAIATLGMMLIPVLRSILMGSDMTKWHNVYRLPGIIAVAVAVLSALLIRETTPFIKKRLEFLRMGDEERAAVKNNKNVEKAQGNIISAIKFVLRYKQLRWLMISGGFIIWGALMPSYYETIMTYGYAGPSLALGVNLEDAKLYAMPFVTQALLLFPIGSAFFQFIQGFLSDKWGRKLTTIIMGACALVFYVLFNYGANHNWQPYLIGFFCGSAIGSFWATIDICGGIMCSESAPTNLRASVMAVQPLIAGVSGLFASLLSTLLLNIFGDAYAGVISLGFSVPGMAIGFVLIMLKVQETRNVNLDEITGREA